jgi:hypothetical protein
VTHIILNALHSLQKLFNLCDIPRATNKVVEVERSEVDMSENDFVGLKSDQDKNREELECRENKNFLFRPKFSLQLAAFLYCTEVCH